MHTMTTTEAARAIGRAIRQTAAGPLVLYNRGDAAAVLVSMPEALRRRLVCEHEADPASCPVCNPAEEPCPHGESVAECNACFVAGDLAFDANRERAAFGGRSRD